MDLVKLLWVKDPKHLPHFGHVCGWVHFKCSGLENSKEYNDNFLCSKCNRSRILLSDKTDRNYAASFTKIHESYTNPRSKAAFGSRRNLVATSQCSPKNVDLYLSSSETYTKFKQTRKRFLRLKVVSYRLNEIWSVDLADMQKLAANNSGIRYLFVAVDALTCYLWVEPLKVKTSQACKEALMRIIAKNGKPPVPKICNATHQPEKIWVDKGREFSGVCQFLSVKSYCNLFHQKRNKVCTGGKKYSISQIIDLQVHARA